MSEGKRVVSGMRPTGACHLGHYHGVLKNWVKLQHEYDCYFFAADWHALTTHYEETTSIEENVWQLIIDWLACGLNPGSCKIFIQSRVIEHAELFLLLGMLSPLGWLERVPTYKDQQAKLKDKDLSTYGFLGYPVLQTADILLYKGGYVPVGDDQISHLELARELARRFNHLYGREVDFEEKSLAAMVKMGKKNAKLFKESMKGYQQSGSQHSLEMGQALISAQASLSMSDRERLLGYLEGSGKIILPEPQALLTASSKLPGLDGQKMSKSYGNTIGLREEPKVVEQKILKMPTDPQRIRRQDPGDPEKCPVWSFHKVYSNDTVKEWVQKGCTSAGIGCIDCKKEVINPILQELAPIRERALEFESNRPMVKEIVRDGTERAREAARETIDEVRDAMGLPSRDR